MLLRSIEGSSMVMDTKNKALYTYFLNFASIRIGITRRRTAGQDKAGQDKTISLVSSSFYLFPFSSCFRNFICLSRKLFTHNPIKVGETNSNSVTPVAKAFKVEEGAAPLITLAVSAPT
mmetsp:Transcript_10162/g.13263  ORF Transcript_10162/g.13263 Transcript_10162/m.13263 type:complete len:119 (-) Transcript_10162:537-893(-)